MLPRLPPRASLSVTGLRACLLASAMLVSPVALTGDADNAVILMYHHVSASTPASTSVTSEVFEQHLQFLAQGHKVIPLEQAVSGLGSNKRLPDRSVVITFDDGYRNIYDNAHPLLVKYKLPYTVFINPQMIGKHKHQLTWQQVREMEQAGARFANHTSHHRHLLERKPGDSQSQWLAEIEQDILGAEAILKEKLGYSLQYVAYPYGEYNADIQSLVSKLGMTGFGQHSGAIYSGSDFTALPRFPAAGIYANLETLKVKINSLAMPVTSQDGDFSFTFSGEDVIGPQMGCYYGNNSLPVSSDNHAVTVTLKQALTVGRSRVNCTAPSRAQPGRYYWYSQPRFVPTKDGRYPD
jgi:peptidoglycan/xylan/chitin deacetylase (PgdA/CDA1 family)